MEVGNREYGVCSVWLQCEGSVFVCHTREVEREMMSRRARSEQLLELYSSVHHCRKPTLFFFLWRSRESLSSASSPCRSETCLSFSDNLTDKNTCYDHNYVFKGAVKRNCVQKICILWYGMQHYSRCKQLWAWHCCVQLLCEQGKERQLKLGLSNMNLISY